MDYFEADELLDQGISVTQCPYCGEWFKSSDGPPCPECDGDSDDLDDDDFDDW